MRISREIAVVAAEGRTLQKIQLAALNTAETIRQSSGRPNFTEKEVKGIVNDVKPIGFQIEEVETAVNIIKS